ncbi:hypothetical protein LEN26_006293 [Aphanomyces euteiches]|nr:hypothetical protein AeMF1_009414 [Aphanomyces euteiches]KAH9136046.1 hypothetical protein LEN26_006293 [Aphanomyces euteiches]KAH9197720.1 hypothetical protein AeNC1_000304 [Aphanomyces euteiches]
MAPRIEQAKELFVAGLQVHVPPGPCPAIEELWARMSPHLQGKPSYGVCYDFADGMYTYLVAIDVEKGQPIPDGWTSMEIPAHDFAVYEHAGHISKIAETWLTIKNDDTVTRDFSVPSIEKYPAGYSSDTSLTIWIPIA